VTPAASIASSDAAGVGAVVTWSGVPSGSGLEVSTNTGWVQGQSGASSAGRNVVRPMRTASQLAKNSGNP
jgi:hypothetical protein